MPLRADNRCSAKNQAAGSAIERLGDGVLRERTGGCRRAETPELGRSGRANRERGTEGAEWPGAASELGPPLVGVRTASRMWEVMQVAAFRPQSPFRCDEDLGVN